MSGIYPLAASELVVRASDLATPENRRLLEVMNAGTGDISMGAES